MTERREFIIFLNYRTITIWNWVFTRDATNYM